MVSWEMRGKELVARIREKGNIRKVLTGKLEGESPMERDRRSCYVNI